MRRALALLFLVTACGTKEKAADTMSMAIDTVKPAPPDTTFSPATKTPATKSGAAQSTKSGASKSDVLGGDSVIRMPLKTLPMPDTTKRPTDNKVAGRDSVIRMPLKTLPMPDTTKTKRP